MRRADEYCQHCIDARAARERTIRGRAFRLCVPCAQSVDTSGRLPRVTTRDGAGRAERHGASWERRVLAVVALCLLSLPAHGIDFNRERLWGNQKTPIPGANYCLCSSDANNATFTQAFATRYVWFDAGSMRGDGTGCNDPAEAQIGSDAEVAEIVCPTTGASAYVWGKVALIEAPASDQIDCTIHGYTTGSYQGTMDVACNCAARPDGTWGTAVSVDTGSISANTGWSVDAADVTCSGTCSAGALLWLRVNYTGGTNAGHTLGVRCSYAPA